MILLCHYTGLLIRLTTSPAGQIWAAQSKVPDCGARYLVEAGGNVRAPSFPQNSVGGGWIDGWVGRWLTTHFGQLIIGDLGV